MAEASIKVSVESILHNEICKVANSIYKNHGITIEGIEFEWVKMDDKTQNLDGCKIRTSLDCSDR